MLSIKKNIFINRIRDFLIIGFSKRAGKNCFGRKTVFTQSGGYRLFYNHIDLKRNLADIFILLSNAEPSMGASGELGAAIGSFITFKKPIIPRLLLNYYFLKL